MLKEIPIEFTENLTGIQNEDTENLIQNELTEKLKETVKEKGLAFRRTSAAVRSMISEETTENLLCSRHLLGYL